MSVLKSKFDLLECRADDCLEFIQGVKVGAIGRSFVRSSMATGIRDPPT
jgi:hypothetical protein